MNNSKPLMLVVFGLAFLTAIVFLFFRGGMMMSSNDGFRSGGMGMNVMPVNPGWVEPGFDYPVSKDLSFQEEYFIEEAYSDWSQPHMMRGGAWPTYPPYASFDALYENERAYDRSAHYSLIVDDVNKYVSDFREYVLQNDGRVMSSSLGTSRDYSGRWIRGRQYQQGYLMVRIPEAKFDEAVNRVVQGVKQVYNQDISVQDITGNVVAVEQHIDRLQLEISIKEDELTRAETDSERRRIQFDLERLRKNLNQALDRQAGVEEQVVYATISLSIADSIKHFESPYYDPYYGGGWLGGDLQFQLMRAWNALVGTLFFLASALIWIAVFAVVWLPIVLVGRKLWSRWKR